MISETNTPHKRSAPEARSGKSKKTPNRQNFEPLSQFLDASCGVTPATFAARRLPEIKALWRSILYEESQNQLLKQENEQSNETSREENVWKSGGKKSSDRHLRRRTGSFNPTRHHRFPARTKDKNNEQNEEDNKSGSYNKQIKCRRARRKPALLCQMHTDYASTSTSTTHWLQTHHWHTKRFHMANLFQWSLPLAHTNRGITPTLRYDVTLQDSTYLTAQPIEIQINRDDCDENGQNIFLQILLQQILPQICGPPPLQFTDDEFILGKKMLDYVVYLPNSYPCRPIGPARFLLRRNSYEKNEDHHKSRFVLTIFIHPSIRSRTKQILEHIISQVNDKIDDKKEKIVDEQNATKNEDNSDDETCEKDAKQVLAFQLADSAPRALLCLRGNHATKCVMEALSPIFAGKSDMGNDSNENEDEEERIIWDEIQHQVSTSCNNDDSQLDDIALRSCLGHGSALDMLIPRSDDCFFKHHEQEKNLKKESTQTFISCIFFSQSPNDKYDTNSNRLNALVSGWDLLLPVEHAKSIFLTLNHHGARTIGLVEEAAAKLEADPPLPLFPRDYPDTEEGKIYWGGNAVDNYDAVSGMKQRNDRAVGDWKILRNLWEHDKDRCGTLIKRLCNRRMHDHQEAKNNVKEEKSNSKSDSLENVLNIGKNDVWDDFVNVTAIGSDSLTMSINDNEEENHLVVVRGTHGAPFLQALSESACVSLTGESEINEGSSNISRMSHSLRRRRPRRKVRNPHQPINAYHLSSKKLTTNHIAICESLLSTLSLPALLRCYLVVEGKGVLSPRAIISAYRAEDTTQDGTSNVYDMDDDNDSKSSSLNSLNAISSIGFVVAGSFSQRRGKYIATGFVSAARFLQCIIRACEEKRNLVIVDSSFRCDKEHVHSKRINMLVTVRNPSPGSIGRKTTLSLLF